MSSTTLNNKYVYSICNRLEIVSEWYFERVKISKISLFYIRAMKKNYNTLLKLGPNPLTYNQNNFKCIH